MERTLAKHPDAFARHRAAHAHFLGTLGYYHLNAGHWLEGIRWSARGVRRNPGDRRCWFFLAACLAGPHGLAAFRRVRPQESTVSVWTLTKRRARKYLRRIGNYPRALVAAPMALATRSIVRRLVLPAYARRERSVLVLAVYRFDNAGTVGSLVDEAVDHGWDVRLWALDRIAPAFAAQTVGERRGAKFPLLNGLLEGQDLDGFDWVVVADDDFAFRNGAIADVLAVAEAAGLDLVQPAHIELSYRDNEIAVRRPLAIARRTTFVEIGPMFAVRRPWAAEILPFPKDHTMGWGLELEWFDLERRGARLGIVDVVPIRHLHPVGKGYAKDEQRERLRTLLEARGLSSFREIQRAVGTWRPWQSGPPWPHAQEE